MKLKHSFLLLTLIFSTHTFADVHPNDLSFLSGPDGERSNIDSLECDDGEAVIEIKGNKYFTKVVVEPKVEELF